MAVEGSDLEAVGRECTYAIFLLQAVFWKVFKI